MADLSPAAQAVLDAAALSLDDKAESLTLPVLYPFFTTMEASVSNIQINGDGYGDGYSRGYGWGTCSPHRGRRGE